MTYDIKDETINGDEATVTAEIEVYDYYKANQESQEYFNNNRDEFKEENNSEGSGEESQEATTDTISNTKYIDYRLTQLQNVNDRVKYTIDFTLKKVDDKWKLNELDDATRQKIHGLYEH